MESETESGEFHLLPPKRLKTTDWTKCVICQTSTSLDDLRKGGDEGIARFASAAKCRQDETFQRLETVIEQLHSMDPVWHRACYQSYTSSHNLKYVQGKRASEASCSKRYQELGHPSRLRSYVPAINWSLCLFCQKKYCKKTKALYSITTFDACTAIQQAADAKGDEEMLAKLAGVDLIAAEAKYHGSCRAQYTSKENLKYKAFKEEKGTEDVYSKAFLKLISSVEVGIRQGKAYELATLLTKYKSILKSMNVSAESYTSQRLKLRLQNYFKDSIVFHEHHDRTKSQLIYSTTISLHDVINTACLREREAAPTDTACSTHADAGTEPMHTLYHAAQILKSDLKDCAGINLRPLSLHELNLNRSKDLLPESLYNFLCWVICKDSGPNPYTQKNQNTADERHIIMLGQDIMHCASHGRVKTPKHISLAMSVRHLTGSKQVINILNRMGHCSSYEEVETVDTSLAMEVVAKSNLLGVVTPSNIYPGVLIQAAADNNDINEETLDGKHTTHATTLVLYQQSQFGPQLQRQTYADHSRRRRTLDTQAAVETILECSTYGKKPSVTQFLDAVKQEWYTSGSSLDDSSSKMDLAWALVRMLPTKLFEVELCPMKPDQQTVPSWSAFNTIVSCVSPCITEVGYCPMLNGSSTDASTVYTVMKQVQKMMSSLGQQYSVITFDLAIYMKAKEIQWRHPKEFDDTVIRMGGFHIALNYLAVIGKMYEESGLADLLVESGIYGCNTATNLLKGKSYNRGVRAHKLVMEALIRLQWEEQCKWLSRKQEDSGVNEDTLTAHIHACKDAVNQRTEDLHECYQVLCDDMMDIQNLMSRFRTAGKTASHLFSFWDTYIEMAQLLLEFIRAERDGCWKLHLMTTARMAPYFFAMDRTNYSRWLPVYLGDMNQLPEKFPEVYEEFLKGNHAVCRSSQPFGRVWTDMALEQSINLDSKKRGGIVGITKKQEALDRWFLTSHERAAITSAMKEMCALQDSERVGTHKETGAARRKRDEGDVQMLISTFKSSLATNPFDVDALKEDECQPLVNIISGAMLPESVAARLVAAKDTGQKQLKEFVSKRLDTNEKSFWETLPRLNIKTFASITKTKTVKAGTDKAATVSADRDLFGRLLIVAKARNVNLKEVLAHELSSVPYALAHSDGSLRKNVKSDLLNELETEADVLPKLPISEEPLPTATAIDAMAMVQMVKSGVAKTFGQLADQYYDIISAPLGQNGCNRVDVVFDRYDKPQSIKAEERMQRGSSTALEIKISGPSTPLPKQWDKYIKNPKNKANLCAFLCERWCQTAQGKLAPGDQLVLGGGFKNGNECKLIVREHVTKLATLESDHEEADTRLLLHAYHASQDHPQVIVQSPDTDVAIICIHMYSTMMCPKLWFRTGVKQRLRYIPIHEIVSAIGPRVCKALPSLHALTGCDSTSAFRGIGKKTALSKLQKDEGLQKQVAQLGDIIPPTHNTIRACEKFVCSLYKTSGVTAGTADEVRYWMFCQRKHKSECLPPTSDSIRLHILRANYQSYVWKKSLLASQSLPDPDGNGWNTLDGTLRPTLMSKDPAPVGLVELTACRCKISACERNRVCACRRQDMPCTEACSCMGVEQCRNPNNVVSSDSDDDGDDDDEY